MVTHSYDVYNKGDPVIRQGEFGDTYYVCLTGACNVHTNKVCYVSMKLFFVQREYFLCFFRFGHFVVSIQAHTHIIPIKLKKKKKLLAEHVADPRLQGIAGIGEIVNTLQPGDDFGERALISEEPRAATIMPTEVSEFLTCSKKHFKVGMMVSFSFLLVFFET